MPNLLNTFQGKDIGFLRAVAQIWGADDNLPDIQTALVNLTSAMGASGAFREMIESLAPESISALQALADASGRLPWSLFCRRFGDLRQMGAARREREKPELQPISTTELLFYRGLIGRAFLDSPDGPQEFAYIPDEFLPELALSTKSTPRPFGREATTDEFLYSYPASDCILDEGCTLLAILRLGFDPLNQPDLTWKTQPQVIHELMRITGLIDADNQPIPEPTRTFLEEPRQAALLRLVEAWRKSSEFNELRLLPDLVFEGNWVNYPFQTRQRLLESLIRIPEGHWWNLDSFIADHKINNPDFQRSAGEYDSWFIYSLKGDKYLRGIESWDAIEGYLIRTFITGTLHSLGLMDLGTSVDGKPYLAFRWSAWSSALLEGKLPSLFRLEEGRLMATRAGLLHLKPQFPRAARYLLSRLAEWEGEHAEEYHYRLTPDSLSRAATQGLRISHLLNLLQKYSIGPLPPTLIKALERFEKFGVQAKIEKKAILRVSSPEALEALKKSRAGRFLGETLNDTTICIQPGKNRTVLTALAELGWLGEEV